MEAKVRLRGLTGGMTFRRGIAAPVPVGESLCGRSASAQAALQLRSYGMAKRIFDIVLSATLLLAFTPVLLLAAAIIRVVDGGPVVFWQIRVGQHGREFWFPKLRSMRVDAERVHPALLEQNDHSDSITFKMREDPRVTPLGRVLRTLSVDELPQLWSVLKNDMSLVGPRPPLPSEVDQYTPMERRRLEVKPGLTCIWQVSGRSALPFEQQSALDIEYIEKRSFWLDLKLLALTVPAVISCKGAW